MQLGDLKKGQNFKVAGWKTSPVFTVRFPVDDPFRLYLLRSDGDSYDIGSKHLVLVDAGDIVPSVDEILETTHVFPATTEVEIVE